MKLKHEFLIREVAGEYVLIPMGASALAFSGMVTTNAVGAFICRKLAEPMDYQTLVRCLCDEFEVAPETAAQDLAEFLQVLRGAGMLEE